MSALLSSSPLPAPAAPQALPLGPARRPARNVPMLLCRTLRTDRSRKKRKPPTKGGRLARDGRGPLDCGGSHSAGMAETDAPGC